MFFIFLLLSFFLSSCQWNRNEKKSILIIAVDSLRTEDINCAASETLSGFNTLCNEFIRFSHAYTTSVLSAPAMTSLLTGRYPFEHGVRDNSFQDISPNAELVAKLASKNNFHTGFFSGGAPILRATQLHKGFEHFDDNLSPSLAQLFRPFDANIELLKNWLEGIKSSPFLATVYVPDLNFTNRETKSDSGEMRPQSIEGQIQEFDENLDHLFKFLKAKDLWKNFHIIVVGLNGRDHIVRKNELTTFNLHSENTQVAFFYKLPFSSRGETEQNWSIDKSVSLADVGKTLIELVSGQSPPSSSSSFPSYSLSSYIHFEKQLPRRPILIESGWPLWQGLSSVRYAILLEPYLMLYDSPPLYYNTLVDKNELYPLSQDEIRDSNLKSEFNQLATSLRTTPWLALDVEAYLKQNNLTLPLQPEWLPLLELNKKRTSESYDLQDPCLKLIYVKNDFHSLQKKCSNELFKAFLKWSTTQKDSDFFRFINEYRFHKLVQQVNIMNQSLSGIWNTNRRLTEQVDYVDLALTLPEFLPLKHKITSSLRN